MKKFYIEACKVREFDRLINELATVADCREGVLLDSSLCYIGDCALAIFEWAETSNSSGYMVYWANDSKHNEQVEYEWECFAEDYDKRFKEVE